MMYSVGNIGALGAVVMLASFAGIGVGDQFDSDKKPPAIDVASVEIWDDETTFYDRRTQDGKWLAWSGQIFSADGDALICRGGDTSQYFNDENPLDTKDVSWLVSPDCAGKLEAGQKFAFTWTPINDDYAPVRFPENGFGTVKAASELNVNYKDDE